MLALLYKLLNDKGNINNGVRMKFYIVSILFTFSLVLNATVYVEKQKLTQGQKLRSLPYYIEEHGQIKNQKTYEEVVDNTKNNKVQTLSLQKIPSGFELRKVIEQGPFSNRINLTFLGDGYTLAEKEKFFGDVNRTVDGLFKGNTFKSYLSLFNVYAVFVPSAQSGIGDGLPKNTAFKLYRTPKGSKRAIYPGDENALEQALKLAPATDYPIVIANDDFYGGLGGRFAISTRSVESGLVVLRHELGHNFGEVGEEYDNGSVYIGANSSRSKNVTWMHWVDTFFKVFESKLLTGDYVWKNLKQGPYQAQFNNQEFADGFFFGQISTVGWQTANDVTVKIDDQVLPLKGKYSSDRNFYDISPVQNFPKGNHLFSAQENIKDGDNVLGFAELYSAPSDYDFTPNRVAAFATFDENQRKTYRPTHGSCLMREMTYDRFCAVDQENIWQKFTNRVSLIDDLKTQKTISGYDLQLKTIQLSGLNIRWFQISGESVIELKNIENLKNWTTKISGNYRLKVSFRTPEVRQYTDGFDVVRDFKLQ